jgi:hypothetical protein
MKYLLYDKEQSMKYCGLQVLNISNVNLAFTAL